MIKFVVVIPSRYASERLPGKPLLQRVYERGTESAASDVVIGYR